MATHGRPFGLFEPGAILLYLAEKSGQLISDDRKRRYKLLQGVMFQISSIGPMFGQVGFFNKFAGRSFDDRQAPARPLRQRVQAPAQGSRPAPGGARLDNGRCLHCGGHLHISVNPQSHRFVWSERSGWHRGFSQCKPCARCLSGAPRRGQGSIHPGRAHRKEVERVQFLVVDGIGSLRCVCDRFRQCWLHRQLTGLAADRF